MEINKSIEITFIVKDLNESTQEKDLGQLLKDLVRKKGLDDSQDISTDISKKRKKLEEPQIIIQKTSSESNQKTSTNSLQDAQLYVLYKESSTNIQAYDKGKDKIINLLEDK